MSDQMIPDTNSINVKKGPLGLQVFAWAETPEEAAEWATYLSHRYTSLGEAIAQRQSDIQGDKTLYRVTVEEVEAPGPRWWYAGQRDDKPILSEETDETGPWVNISQTGAHIWRECRVQAYDRDDAETEARRAWRDLAANLAEGGA